MADLELQNLNIKLFFKDLGLKIEDFVPFFHRWIQENYTPELLLDVVDYSHIRRGPGILLIGHESNYSVDTAIGGRVGFLYARKMALPGSAAEVLRISLLAALKASLMVQEKTGCIFATDQIHLVVNDRLLAPNTAPGFQALAGLIREALPSLGLQDISNPGGIGQRLQSLIRLSEQPLDELIRKL